MKHHLIQIDAAGLFVADVPQWDDGARDPVDGVQMMHDGLPVLDEQGEPVWEIPPQPAIPPNPVPPLHVNTPCPGGFVWPQWTGTAWAEGGTLSAAAVAAAAKAAQDAQDLLDAKAYLKLQALAAMTPAQVGNWVTANVTTLAQAQDAIKTLAIAVSILARRL